MAKLSSKKLDDLLSKWKENQAFNEAYASLEEEFVILDEAIRARKEQNLTQTEAALRMGLPRSAVCRLERGLVSGKMPTIPMLRRYAKAIGKKLEIRLV